MKTLDFLKSYSKGNIGRMIGIVCANVAYVFFALLTPLLVGFVVDSVIGNEEVTNSILKFIVRNFGGLTYFKANLWFPCVLLALSTIISGIFVFLYKRGNAYLSEDIAKKLKDDLYNHIMHLPFSYYTASKNGDLVQRCTSDVNQVRQFFASQISEVTSTIAKVIVAMVILAGINWKLLLWAIVTYPAIIIFSFFYYKRMHQVFEKYDEIEGKLNSVVEQNASGVRVVKAFNNEREEIKKFEVINKEYAKENFNLVRLMGIYWAVSFGLGMVQQVIVIIAGVYFNQKGSLSVGNYFVFISYTAYLIWPIRNLGRTLANITKMNVAIKRIKEIFDEQVEDMESGCEHQVSGQVTLDNVFFAYDENTKVLNGVSFDVKAGEVVAVMGATGSGKSSLIHLLTRLYDYEGSIKMDGVELKDFNRGNLRKQVGIVLQEPFLFSKTIRENIMIASNGDEEAMHRACRIASAEDFIQSFDKKFETEVGEKGVTLSGGQKQRIAIARTIINDCPIIMFDDSLSALDAETDAAIRKELNNLPSHPTIFIITHRVISAKDADKIVVLEDGVVSQLGTHEELMQQDGLYKRVANIQSQLQLGGE